MFDSLARLNAALEGRYRLERELGRGGMATVYLAEDVKHRRKVALKVLKPDLAAVLGPERFVQEITTTASLQHPHILPLFDSGTAGEKDGGTPYLFYVMPFIEGETLREKLDRETQLSIEDAVRIAREVADALDYAHRAGVIHRDIKPENILLHDGRPMVADFGIALAVSAAAGGRMTETGLSLGTPHYMSPEQATAEKDLSNRSDIYSLGAVLYEMLAGDPPHTGSTAQQIIMKIVMDEARPVTDLRKSVPPNVECATARALERLPADRFGSADEFAAALANPGFRTQLSTATGTPSTMSASALPSVAWTALIVGLAILAVVGWWPSGEVPRDVTRVVLSENPPIIQVSARAGGPSFTLSPDGSSLVWVGPGATLGVGHLYRRRFDRLDAEKIPGTEGAQGPFFSPDGEWVAFYTSSGIMKIPIDGGQAIPVVDNIRTTQADGYWADDGFIYISYPEEEAAPGRLVAQGVARVDATGGPLQLLERDEAIERDVLGHVVLSGGRWLLYADCAASICGSESPPRIVARDLRSGETVLVVDNAAWPHVLESGYLLFVRDGAVFAVPFDGNPRVITDRPVVASIPGTGLNFSVADNGTMVYVPPFERGSDHLVVVDKEGRERQLTTRPNAFNHPRIDPGGRRVAVTLQGARPGIPLQASMESQIAIYDIGSSTLSQFTVEGENARATWSPDGRSLAFESLRDGRWSVYTRPANASAPATPLNGGTSTALHLTPSWAPNGDWILTDELVGESSTDDIFAVSTRNDSLRILIATPSRETVPAVSPDSRWLAYVSDESGPEEVYVTPFLAQGGRTQVSDRNGDMPLWVSNNALVYIASDGTLTLVELDVTDGVRVTSRTSLFSVEPYVLDANAWPYDVMPGSEEFLFVRRGGSRRVPVLVLNWVESLKEALGGGG
jgi:eukaryotic-like serine/threonine-protein kinase